MLYAYSYQEPRSPFPVTRTLSYLSFLTGLGLLALVIFPMASYQINYFLLGPSLLNPMTRQSVLAASSNADYNNANNWFIGANNHPLGLQLTPVSTFSLSVPKLNIKNANVTVDGPDLKKSLVGWATSVSPGSNGSVFVFGHSALPAFYSPSSYTTIFTHIYDLDYGDKIILDSDGVSYVYEVESKRIVKPDDLSVLEQRYDASRLVLITCLPAGTYLNRGVVTARLVGT